MIGRFFAHMFGPSPSAIGRQMLRLADDQSAEVLAPLSKLHPTKHVEAIQYTLRLLQLDDRHAETRPFLDRISQLDPLAALLPCFEHAQVRKDPAFGIKAAQRALDIHAKNLTARMIMARLKLEAGRAKEVIEDTAHITPSDSELCLLRAQALAGVGRVGEGRKLAEAVLELQQRRLVDFPDPQSHAEAQALVNEAEGIVAALSSRR